MAALVMLAGSACSSAPSATAGADSCTPKPGPLTIATGSASGVYAALGSKLAAAVSTSTPLQAKAVETGSTLRNVQQLSTGEYDIAFAQADSASDAVRGQGVFAEPQKIQALSRIYSDYTQVVVTTASGIRTMADFKGKRISTGAPSSGTELIAGRLLTAAGLNPKTDVTAQSLDLPSSVAAIKAGTIDGFVWSGGLPTEGVAQLFATDGAKLTFVDVAGLLPAMAQLGPGYTAGTIPGSVYHRPGDVPTIAMPNLLVVRSDFDPAVACAVTKVLFEKKDELAAAVPAAAGIDLKTAGDTAPLTLDPGARAALEALTKK